MNKNQQDFLLVHIEQSYQLKLEDKVGILEDL